MKEVNVKASLRRVPGQVWYLALMIPKASIIDLELNKDRRVVCLLSEDTKIHAALMHDGQGDFFINLNKDIRKKMNYEEGQTVSIIIKGDDSDYGMPLPEELQTAWELDTDSYDVFHSLTKGKQRSLIHLIGKLKSSEKRIHKSLVMLEYLKSVNGKLDFKELNQAFKEANR